jgi:hypothetical protein
MNANANAVNVEEKSKQRVVHNTADATATHLEHIGGEVRPLERVVHNTA